MNVAQQQKPPIPADQNQHRDIADLVVNDIVHRKEDGLKKYKVPLRAFNGRSALIDAYQEAVDQTLYLRQELEEREKLLEELENKIICLYQQLETVEIWPLKQFSYDYQLFVNKDGYIVRETELTIETMKIIHRYRYYWAVRHFVLTNNLADPKPSVL